IVRATAGDEPGLPVGTDEIEKIGQPRPTKTADRVPALDAHMPRVLDDSRQAANLIECVAAGTRHGATHREGPAGEIDCRLEQVVAVVRKTGERTEVAIGECPSAGGPPKNP